MNCKPGDLAVVVRRSPRNDPLEDKYLGALLKVVSINERVSAEWPGYVFWNFAPISPVLIDAPVKWCLDYCLRPIRDTGDDAKDEMLRPLPKEVTA